MWKYREIFNNGEFVAIELITPAGFKIGMGMEISEFVDLISRLGAKEVEF